MSAIRDIGHAMATVLGDAARTLKNGVVGGVYGIGHAASYSLSWIAIFCAMTKDRYNVFKGESRFSWLCRVVEQVPRAPQKYTAVVHRCLSTFSQKDLNRKDGQGNGLLHNAIEQFCRDENQLRSIVEAIIPKVDLSLRNNLNQTAAQFAYSRGKYGYAATLLKAQEELPLHFAMRNDMPLAALELVNDDSVDPLSISDDTRATPLHVAVSNLAMDDVAIALAQRLQRSEHSIDQDKNAAGLTPLDFLCQEGSPRVLEELLTPEFVNMDALYRHQYADGETRFVKASKILQQASIKIFDNYISELVAKVVSVYGSGEVVEQCPEDLKYFAAYMTEDTTRIKFAEELREALDEKTYNLVILHLLNAFPKSQGIYPLAIALIKEMSNKSVEIEVTALTQSQGSITEIAVTTKLSGATQAFADRLSQIQDKRNQWTIAFLRHVSESEFQQESAAILELLACLKIDDSLYADLAALESGKVYLRVICGCLGKCKLAFNARSNQTLARVCYEWAKKLVTFIPDEVKERERLVLCGTIPNESSFLQVAVDLNDTDLVTEFCNTFAREPEKFFTFVLTFMARINPTEKAAAVVSRLEGEQLMAKKKQDLLFLLVRCMPKPFLAFENERYQNGAHPELSIAKYANTCKFNQVEIALVRRLLAELGAKEVPRSPDARGSAAPAGGSPAVKERTKAGFPAAGVAGIPPGLGGGKKH